MNVTIGRGGVFHFKDDLSKIHKDNQPLKALYYDLSVPQFLSGCQALRLINKFVTTLLWKVSEPNEHVKAKV